MLHSSQLLFHPHQNSNYFSPKRHGLSLCQRPSFNLDMASGRPSRNYIIFFDDLLVTQSDHYYSYDVSIIRTLCCIIFSCLYHYQYLSLVIFIKNVVSLSLPVIRLETQLLLGLSVVIFFMSLLLAIFITCNILRRLYHLVVFNYF